MMAVNYGTNNGKTITLEHDYTLNPTTVLTFRAGVVRYVTTSGLGNGRLLRLGLIHRNVGYLLGTTNNRVPQMLIEQ